MYALCSLIWQSIANTNFLPSPSSHHRGRALPILNTIFVDVYSHFLVSNVSDRDKKRLIQKKIVYVRIKIAHRSRSLAAFYKNGNAMKTIDRIEWNTLFDVCV